MKLHIKILAYLACAATLFCLGACEENYYEEELYRKEIYIVSGENNIFGQEFGFGGDVANVSIYVSGTTPVEKPVTVELEYDNDIIVEYNNRNFDQDFHLYAKELPTANYTLPEMSVIIRPENENPYTGFPIEVNIDALDPSETYFIPLRIKSVSDYMASLEKDYVLVQAFMKNEYATTKTTTYYLMSGTQEVVTWNGSSWDSDGVQSITSSKLVVPIGTHSIRMLPAARATTDNTTVRRWSLNVTVYPDETVDVPIYDESIPTGEYIQKTKVLVTPFLDSQDAMEVQEVDGEVSYYDPDYRMFILNYRYKLAEESSWYEMYEIIMNTNYY